VVGSADKTVFLENEGSHMDLCECYYLNCTTDTNITVKDSKIVVRHDVLAGHSLDPGSKFEVERKRREKKKKKEKSAKESI